MHLHVILPWSWKTCMTREDPEFDLHLLSQKPFFQKLNYSSWHDLQTCSCSPWSEKDMPVYQTPIKAVMFFLHVVYTLSALKHPFCAAARTLSFILLWLPTFCFHSHFVQDPNRFPLTFFVLWQDFWVSEKLNFIRSRGFYFTSTNCERSPNCGEIKVHEESCQIDFQTWETLIVCHVQITQEILKNCYDKNEAWTFLLSNRERARKIATQGCVFIFYFFSPDKKLKQARQLLQLTVNAAGFKCFGTPQFEC